MNSEPLFLENAEPARGRRRKTHSPVPIVWLTMLAVFLTGNLSAVNAYAASSATTTPSTSQRATTVATTVPTTVATTVPTTAVTTTTEPSTTTTTTASTTSTTKRRVVVGIAATRGLVVTEESGNTQSGWIAFGILLVVFLGLAVAWFVHERRRQGPAGSGDKPAA
jgi:hypothetical protein